MLGVLKDLADDGHTRGVEGHFARVKLIIASRKLIIREFVNGSGNSRSVRTNGAQIIDGSGT